MTITDEFGNEYELAEHDAFDDYDSDDDAYLSRQEFEEFLARQEEEQAYADQEAQDAWLDHLALHVSAAEQALGRELTGKELLKFEDQLDASGGEGVNIEDYHRDVSDDDQRVNLLAEYVESGPAGEPPEGGEE
jgi:hypothetical protein